MDLGERLQFVLFAPDAQVVLGLGGTRNLVSLGEIIPKRRRLSDDLDYLLFAILDRRGERLGLDENLLRARRRRQHDAPNLRPAAEDDPVRSGRKRAAADQPQEQGASSQLR